MDKITLGDIESAVMRDVFGDRDENIRYIEERYNVSVSASTGGIVVRGANNEAAAEIIGVIAKRIEKGEKVGVKEIRVLCDMHDDGKLENIDMLDKCILINARGKQIKPKTIGQAVYVKAIAAKQIVFGIGPAGTGKTYLAVAMAVKAYKDKLVEKIILTRPAVEAGEKLGFLPGDLGAKVDPYLRPLYDALSEMFGAETYNRLLEKGIIEIAPLAYMRGRTLSNAFIILDEAQNTTREQMKMFLTRMGEGSRMVVTGDVTQIDLPNKAASGLVDAVRILENVDGIGIVRLGGKDVVRHELVVRIVKAYEAAERLKDANLKENDPQEKHGE